MAHPYQRLHPMDLERAKDLARLYATAARAERIRGSNSHRVEEAAETIEQLLAHIELLGQDLEKSKAELQAALERRDG